MGEALLELQAAFTTEGAAQAAMTAMHALIAENAYDWWQQHRYKGDAAQFWAGFKARFPLSYDVLLCTDPDIDKAGDQIEPADGLAGLLDWRDTPEIDHERPIRVPRVRGTELIHDALTWYWARWYPLASWLIRRHGAKRVRWQNTMGDFTLSASSKLMRTDIKPEQALA